MICTPCGGGSHKKCKGRTRCDCQHREASKPPAQTIILDLPITSAEEFGEM